jgi:hypothetical protein
MAHRRAHVVLLAIAATCGAAAKAQNDPPVPAPQPAAPPQQPAPAKPKPKRLEWKVDDYTVRLGGFVKVDLIHDFDEIGSTDSFDPRTIPTDDESDPGMNTRMHARSSRLNLDVRGPSDLGELRVYVEGDFFSDQNGFRLRHAFGTIGGWLGGQTWSTFMDEDAVPETLDFESAIAYPLIRQAMIRYTHDLGDGSYVAVALEDPASNVVAPPVPGEVEEAAPDLTGRLRWTHDRGHAQLSVFAGVARFDPDAGSAQNEFLCGANLSARLEVCERDHLLMQTTYGPGVGRYRGGITAGPDADGELDAVEIFGVLGGFQHHWSDRWRSTVCYSWAKGDGPAGMPPTSPEVVDYLAANLIWQFSERAWIGVEYLHGSLETADEARGEANRVQIAMSFDL